MVPDSDFNISITNMPDFCDFVISPPHLTNSELREKTNEIAIIVTTPLHTIHAVRIELRDIPSQARLLVLPVSPYLRETVEDLFFKGKIFAIQYPEFIFLWKFADAPA